MSLSVSAQLNAAFAEIGGIFGSAYTQYRPISPLLSPVDPSCQFGSIVAGFDISPNLLFRAPGKFANSVYYGAFDPSLVQHGDYLVCATATYFVAGLEPGKPALCVRCERTISVKQPAALPTGAGGYGAQGYSGVVRSAETALFSQWPVSMLQGTKGNTNLAALASDVRTPWFNIQMPALFGVVISVGDQITDDLGRTMTISSPELTHLGYRITAEYAGT